MKKHVHILVFLIASGIPSFGKNIDVEFIKISNNVWIHRSFELISGNLVPSNGLIIESKHNAILVDTAWNDEETNQIIDFINETIRKPIAACLISHFHKDRAGGIGVVSRNRIPVYMTKQTYELLGRPGISPRYIDVPHHKIEIDGIPLMIDYFGPAHSPDNVTIWEETNMLLFGGCLIKSLDSMTLGNIADADLKNWPIGIEKLQGKYANARIVVPGHGDYGDSDLLDHTYQLFK